MLRQRHDFGHAASRHAERASSLVFLCFDAGRDAILPSSSSMLVLYAIERVAFISGPAPPMAAGWLCRRVAPPCVISRRRASLGPAAEPAAQFTTKRSRAPATPSYRRVASFQQQGFFAFCRRARVFSPFSCAISCRAKPIYRRY